jgi:hypothetical protein
MKEKRVVLFRTAGEWDLIEKKIRKMGKSDIHIYLNTNISRLKMGYNECRECVSSAQGELIRKSHIIPDHLYPYLQDMARLMQKPISTIVDDLLIAPLLTPEYNAAL